MAHKTARALADLAGPMIGLSLINRGRRRGAASTGATEPQGLPESRNFAVKRERSLGLVIENLNKSSTNPGGNHNLLRSSSVHLPAEISQRTRELQH
jgi:hypothetical protein